MDIATFLMVLSSLHFQDSTLQQHKPGKTFLTNAPIRPQTAGNNHQGKRTATATFTQAERPALIRRIKRGGWDHN